MRGIAGTLHKLAEEARLMAFEAERGNPPDPAHLRHHARRIDAQAEMLVVCPEDVA